MVRSKRSGETFRAAFELLETRTLMAADLAVQYSSAAFLASSADDGATYVHASNLTIAPVGAAARPAGKAAAPKAPANKDPNVNWVNGSLNDTALKSLITADVKDGVINRKEMLDIFKQVQKDGKVTANEFKDLKTLVNKSALFKGFEYVAALAGNVVLGNTANARYQGAALGNLTAGSTATKLDKLVHKWFLGDDHPTAMAGTTYKQAAGSLFPHTPVYTDVRQGMVGDCYFLASLSEAAYVNPSLISSMFIVNGDGTYTVKFNRNGKPDYITVDSQLPVDSSGRYVYANMGKSANDASNPLWVALAEKAYAQLNEEGWLRASFGDTGSNSYAAISGGYMFQAMNQITGQKATYNVVDVGTFTTPFNNHKMITFGSVSNPGDGVVGGHAYAVVGYDASAQKVTLYNPWGINNGSAPGLLTLTWAQMANDFNSMQYTV